jgi:hypothetical protein
VFKEYAVTRPTTGAVGVNGVAEEEDDGNDGDGGGGEGRVIFGKPRDNTLSWTTSHPRVRAATPYTRSSLTDSAHATRSGSMVNASHPKPDTSVMTVSFSDGRTITPPSTPRVLTRQPSPHSTPPYLQALDPVGIPEMHISGEGDVSHPDRPLKQEVPIQRIGQLQTADHEVELRAFLASHGANTRMVYTPKVVLDHPQT